MTEIEAVRLAHSRAKVHGKRFAVCCYKGHLSVLTHAHAKQCGIEILEVCGW